MNNNESVALSQIHRNFAHRFVNYISGPYKEHLQVVYIMKGIYCIMFKKGVLRNGKELNHTNMKVKLASTFSDAAEQLGLKHCIRYQVDGYNGIYLYLNTWDSNRDIRNAKKYLASKKTIEKGQFHWQIVGTNIEHKEES